LFSQDASIHAPLTETFSASEPHSAMRFHALVLSLVFIFLIPWEGVEIGGLGAVAKWVGFVAAAYWFATILRTGQLRAPRAFHLAAFAFVAWIGLSVAWSKDPGTTAERALTWVQLFVFVLMLWDLFTTRTAIIAGLQAYVLGAYVATASALANYLSGASYYSHFDRFAAGDTNPDGFGFILAMGMPVAWYLASSKGASLPEKALRFLNFAYVPVALLGISLSGTRTALIATIPAMAFGLSSLMRLKRGARIVVLLLLASPILVLLSQLEMLRSFQRFGTIYDEVTQGDLNNRTNNWLEGLGSFEKHPLIGVGGNMYRSQNSLGKVAHNTYLSVLVELGFIGFALFAVVLGIAVALALGQTGWERSFWLCQFSVWSIGAFTLTWEHRKSTWLFLGLVVASAALASERDDAAPADPGDRVARKAAIPRGAQL
jgi:O-antigen ligase